MLDELRDYRWYAEDMTHPSEAAIKYIFEKEDGFILLDKKENGEPIYTLHNQFAEDHIFFRGTYKNIVCSAKTAQGLSDHDMIVAEVTL